MTCVTVLAAGLVPIVSSGVVAHAETLRPDPPTVTMICATDQFDINTSDAASIVAAFGIDPAVAQRWVAEGPWLQPSDLLTVQGIGPGWLTPMLAARRLCALPPSVPPPTFDVCTGSRVDVQTATAAQLRSVFRMSPSTVAYFVAARPFQALRQITPERVPGLGASKQRAIRKIGCLTPASVITATTNWRWAYPDTTTRDARGLFALTVPAGTLPNAIGGWLSITDSTAPSSVLVGPAADFHIWTDWSDGVRTVAATVPLAPPTGPEDAAAWTPAIVHFPTTTEPEIGVNAGITVDPVAGTATTNLATLSVVQSTRLPSKTAPTNLSTVFTKRTWLESIERWALGLRAQQPSCSPDQSGDPLLSLSGSIFNYSGATGAFPFLWCLEGSAPGASRLKLVNNTAVVFDIQSDGSPPLYSTADARQFLSSGDAVADFVFSHRNALPIGHDGSGPFVNHAQVPGVGGVVLQLSQSSTTSLTAVPDTVMSGWALAFRHISDVIPSDKLQTFYNLLNGCAWDQTHSESDVASKLSCVKDAAAGLGEASIVAAASVGLFALDGVFALGDLGIGTLYGSWTYQSPVPPPPPPSGTDGTIVDGATSPGYLWRLNINNQRDSTVYLILPTQQAAGANDLIDPDRVACLSQHYPLRDFAPWPPLPWTQELAAPAPCPDTPPITLAANATNWILREGDGHAFFVDSQSHLESIVDGGSYISCAQKYLVLDFVPESQVTVFGDPNTAPPATCG